jgi:four helix bundle protein
MKIKGFSDERYKISKGFPKDEAYGLTSQIKRCAISIPSNIAEGYGRNPTNEYIHFLRIARVLYMNCKPEWKFL